MDRKSEEIDGWSASPGLDADQFAPWFYCSWAWPEIEPVVGIKTDRLDVLKTTHQRPQWFPVAHTN